MIFQERLLSRKVVECAKRTWGDQTALNMLGSNWSACFPLASSSLYHTSATRILHPHKSEHVLLLVSAFPFRLSHSVQKLTPLPCAQSPTWAGPGYLSDPVSYRFAHFFKPTNALPSTSGICISYSLCVQYSSPVYSHASLLSFIHMSLQVASPFQMTIVTELRSPSHFVSSYFSLTTWHTLQVLD